MAAILQFQKKQDGEKQAFTAGHSATILIYTGVRFERIDFAALTAMAQAMDPMTRVAN
jgi:hypothetical protein